jgi:5'-3' exonuclease
MLEKLGNIEKKYLELREQSMDPEIISDTKRSIGINKEIKVNQRFLYEYLLILGFQEKKWLIEKSDRFKEGKIRKSGGDLEDKELEPWEREWNKFQHTDFWRKNHPIYSTVASEFKKIDFRAGDRVWKKQYYQEFFGVNYDDKRLVKEICQEYLKSWFYCLYYYLDGVPDWRWYYPYHASPLPSDLAMAVKGIKDINHAFKFSLRAPYRPLEQLMLVLPKKAARDGKFLSPKFIKIMDQHPEYYPDRFKLNVLWGQKYIYSEPILPKIDDEVILKEMKGVKMTEEEKRLNTLHDQPLVYM